MSIDLNDPVAVLLAALQALERAGIEAAAYGGLALAVYGEPRETKDAEILATRERDLEDAVTVVHSLASRIDMDLIERELEALAIEISDHDVMGRWQRAQGR